MFLRHIFIPSNFFLQLGCIGALVSIQQVLPAMVKAKTGTILLTGATASLRGSSMFAPFAISKFALRALAQVNQKH